MFLSGTLQHRDTLFGETVSDLATQFRCGPILPSNSTHYVHNDLSHITTELYEIPTLVTRIW